MAIENVPLAQRGIFLPEELESVPLKSFSGDQFLNVTGPDSYRLGSRSFYSSQMALALPDLNQAAKRFCEITRRYNITCRGVEGEVEVNHTTPVDISVEKRTKQVIKNIQPSVVGIFVDGEEKNSETGKMEKVSWLGSGYVISPKDAGLVGYKPKPGTVLVMTNHHVANGAKSIEVEAFDGTRHKANAKMVVGSEELDAAIIEVETNGLRLTPVPIGKPEDVEQGDFVLTFGQPRGLRYTVTSGIVSALRPEEGMIQTDAPINPGNSGGPLVDLENGHVIGTNSSKIPGDDGMGFAIPIWDQLAALQKAWAMQKVLEETEDLPEAEVAEEFFDGPGGNGD